MQKLIFLTFLSLITMSCATPPSSQPVRSWSQHQTAINHIQEWTLRGAVGVTEPNQQFSANVYWQYRPNNYQIDLFGPLGIGANKLTASAKQFSLTNSQGQTLTASSPESLIQQQLGITLPVSNLIFWVRGLPAPGIPHQQQLNSKQQLASLDQQGWHIIYQGYLYEDGIALPRKVVLTRQDITVRIIIDDWRL